MDLEVGQGARKTRNKIAKYLVIFNLWVMDRWTPFCQFIVLED